MPELPEVETVRRGLEPVLTGATVAAVRCIRRDLRRPVPPDLESRLTNRRILAVRRRAKYLMLDAEDGASVLLHLGMSGSLRVTPPPVPAPEKHEHVEFLLAGGTAVRFRDPRRFGLVLTCDTAELPGHPLLAGLGPEPIDPGFDGRFLARRLGGRRTSIKAALLDQTVVAGLGNIYACESLFRAGILPTRPADSITGDEADGLAEAIRAVLHEAIAAGGSSLRDHRRTDGELGYFQHAFAVYDREGRPCPGCCCEMAETGGVRRIVQGGRSTFYCVTRQR